MNKIYETLVPAEIEGKNTDLSHTVAFESIDAAKDCFWRASKRLLNPPLWHDLCGTLSPTFKLIAIDGEEANRLATVGDYFQINLPAPGNVEGDGFDWVRLEAIEDNSDRDGSEESFGIRIRASHRPDGQTNKTAHFFKGSATSTYILHRKNQEVTAYYFGRNEKPNTDTDRTVDNIRNSLIAAGGFIGLSELQWNALLHGLLAPEIGGKST